MTFLLDGFKPRMATYVAHGGVVGKASRWKSGTLSLRGRVFESPCDLREVVAQLEEREEARAC